MSLNEIKLEIIEQPSLNYLMLSNENDKAERFIVNELYANSKQSNNAAKKSKQSSNSSIYPKVKINDPQNRNGQLVVSCVQKTPTSDGKYYVHSNKLVGKKCKMGVAIYEFTAQDNIIDISDLAIVKIIDDKAVKESIESLSKLKIDPFKAGHKFDTSSIDFNQIRLAFQAFLRDKNSPRDPKKIFITNSIVSNVISNSNQSIRVEYIDRLYDTVNGGSKMCILFQKQAALSHQEPSSSTSLDLKIKFFNNINDNYKWSVYADIDFIHYKCAIVCHVPAYYTDKLTNEKKCNFQLCYETNKQIATATDEQQNCVSDIFTFTYKPNVKPTKRPLAYDEYYECETIDAKNSSEIPADVRRALSMRTKQIWSLEKAVEVKTIESNERNVTYTMSKLNLELKNSTSDLFGNNFLLKYSNDSGLHFLEPRVEREMHENNHELLSLFVNKSNYSSMRVTHPTNESIEAIAAVDVVQYSNLQVMNVNSNIDEIIQFKNDDEVNNNNKVKCYNIDQIIDLIDDA